MLTEPKNTYEEHMEIVQDELPNRAFIVGQMADLMRRLKIDFGKNQTLPYDNPGEVRPMSGRTLKETELIGSQDSQVRHNEATVVLPLSFMASPIRGPRESFEVASRREPEIVEAVRKHPNIEAYPDQYKEEMVARAESIIYGALALIGRQGLPEDSNSSRHLIDTAVNAAYDFVGQFGTRSDVSELESRPFILQHGMNILRNLAEVEQVSAKERLAA